MRREQTEGWPQEHEPKKEQSMEKKIRHVESKILLACASGHCGERFAGMANWEGHVVWLAATPDARDLHDAEGTEAGGKLWPESEDLPEAGGVWVWEGYFWEN